MTTYTTPQEILTDAETDMQNAYHALHKQFDQLRTGRASPALLETIQVKHADIGVSLLQHQATITASDAQTLLVKPYDKALMPAIEKGIRGAGLDLNPMPMGDFIRVPLPSLSEQRRKDIVKRIHQETEVICNEIRSHRRTANQRIKDLLKQKLISEDQDHQSHNKIQKLTNKLIEKVNTLAAEKERQVTQI